MKNTGRLSRSVEVFHRFLACKGLVQIAIKGLLNISLPWQINAQEETAIISWRECSKKSVQQGRSHFGARSVLSVREHGTMARTPLAAFFNSPMRLIHDECAGCGQIFRSFSFNSPTIRLKRSKHLTQTSPSLRRSLISDRLLEVGGGSRSVQRQ